MPLVVTLVVMLVAIGCVVGAQLAWAEGPFDVDSNTGGVRGAGTTGIVVPDDQDGTSGSTVIVCSSMGIIGSDWFGQLITRVTIEYLISADKMAVKHSHPGRSKAPAVDGASR